MSVEIVTAEEFAALAVRVAELEARLAAASLVEPSPYMTVAEAAAYIRSKPQRIYDLTSSRRLPKVMDGGKPLIRRSDLAAYLDEGLRR